MTWPKNDWSGFVVILCSFECRLPHVTTWPRNRVRGGGAIDDPPSGRVKSQFPTKNIWRPNRSQDADYNACTTKLRQQRNSTVLPVRYSFRNSEVSSGQCLIMRRMCVKEGYVGIVYYSFYLSPLRNANVIHNLITLICRYVRLL